MDKPDIKAIMQELRAIRGVAVEDIAHAMSSYYSELKPGKKTDGVRPMTAEEILRLEQSGVCEASHETLFLLARVLGVGVGYVPWLVDLIYPQDHILDDPIFRTMDERAAGFAAQQRYAPGERTFEDTLPITSGEAKSLYQKTGFIADPKIRALLLSRFLRQPFPQDRYEVFVTALKDGDLYPFLSPGSIALVDTKDELTAQDQPRMEDPYYLCTIEKGHRCGWPIRAANKQILKTMQRDGSWQDLHDAVPIGSPLQITWSARPLERHDFWMQDHRDRYTLEFILEVRKMYPPRFIQ